MSLYWFPLYHLETGRKLNILHTFNLHSFPTGHALVSNILIHSALSNLRIKVYPKTRFICEINSEFKKKGLLRPWTDVQEKLSEDQKTFFEFLKRKTTNTGVSLLKWLCIASSVSSLNESTKKECNVIFHNWYFSDVCRGLESSFN